jgi:hypothetical protein
MKTLEDIAPVNHKALSHVDTMPENENKDYVRMLLTDPHRCVVGEAHGWNANYKCNVCFNQSVMFCDVVDWNGRRYDIKKPEYNKRVKSFMSHWNKKHGRRQ